MRKQRSEPHPKIIKQNGRNLSQDTMESPREKDTHFVRCLKCGKILQCSRYDTLTLLDHIRKEHPDIIITNDEPPKKAKDRQPSPRSVDFTGQDDVISIKSEPLDAKKSEEVPLLPEKSSSQTNPSVTLPNIKVCENCDIDSDKDNGDYQKKASDDDIVLSTLRNQGERLAKCTTRGNLYRTSIEKWRPANGTIYCPKCGQNRRPLIKSRTETITGNSFCATCILTCWPFCFLPFLIPGTSKEYLHCGNCKIFLGLYDRDNNCVRPNREFVDVLETQQNPK